MPSVNVLPACARAGGAATRHASPAAARNRLILRVSMLILLFVRSLFSVGIFGGGGWKGMIRLIQSGGRTARPTRRMKDRAIGFVQPAGWLRSKATTISRFGPWTP